MNHPSSLSLLFTRLRDVIGRLNGTESGVAGADTDMKAELSTAEQIISELEEQLVSREFQFRDVFETAVHGMALANLTGRFIMVNQAMCDLLGYSEQELITRNFRDITHEDDLEADSGNVKKLLSGEIHSFHMEKRYIHKSGKFIWGLLSASLIRDIKGNPLHFLGHVIDISKLKTVEKALAVSEERFTLAMKGSNDGLWDWNLETGHIYFSPRWKSMLGYSNDEIDNDIREWLRLIHPDDCKRVLTIEDDYLKGRINTYEAEIRMKHKGGHWVDVLTRGFAVRRPSDKVPVRFVGTHMDITERKKVEEQLRQAKDRAESAVRIRSEFLANMSHEIRTPLNSVIGFSELLMNYSRDDTVKEYAASIQKSGSSLLKMINDILDMAKIEAGMMTLQLKPVRFGFMMSEIMEVFTGLSREKKLRFLCEIDPDLPYSLVVDDVRLRQVLLNIIGNAFKFTEEGHVNVTVRLKRTDPYNTVCDVVIKVEDTGIGIPGKELETLYQSFRRYPSQLGGAGLGLSISKKLIEMMNGTIEIHSRLGQGTIVEITLEDMAFLHAETDEEDSFQDVNQSLAPGDSVLFVENRGIDFTALAYEIEQSVLVELEASRSVIKPKVIKSVAERLAIIGEQFDANMFRHFSALLHVYAERFETEKIKQTVLEFLDVYELIKKKGAKGNGS